MRAILIPTLLALLPVAAEGAPLCHDLKGLYTPCPGPGAAKAAASSRASSVAVAEPASPAKPRPARDRPPTFARAKLCRDGKGLFTPCPR